MATPLERALTENRRHIVKQVLERCGYHADSEPSVLSNEVQDFDGTETELLSSGQLHCRRWWLRSLNPKQRKSRCPSPWSSIYLQGLWRRLRYGKPAN